MWSQQKNYLEKHSLSARRAESSQTRPFSYYFLSAADTRTAKQTFIKKNGRRWERGENRTGGERVGVERRSDGERRGWLLEPGRGHGVPVGRNSGKHP